MRFLLLVLFSQSWNIVLYNMSNITLYCTVLIILCRLGEFITLVYNLIKASCIRSSAIEVSPPLKKLDLALLSNLGLNSTINFSNAVREVAAKDVEPITPTQSTSAQQQIGRRGHLRAVPS